MALHWPAAQVALLRLHQDRATLSGMAAHRAYPQGMNDADLDEGVGQVGVLQPHRDSGFQGNY